MGKDISSSASAPEGGRMAAQRAVTACSDLLSDPRSGDYCDRVEAFRAAAEYLYNEIHPPETFTDIISAAARGASESAVERALAACPDAPVAASDWLAPDPDLVYVDDEPWATGPGHICRLEQLHNASWAALHPMGYRSWPEPAPGALRLLYREFLRAYERDPSESGAIREVLRSGGDMGAYLLGARPDLFGQRPMHAMPGL